MNAIVTANCNKVKTTYLLLPLFCILFIVGIYIYNQQLNVLGYLSFQKKIFYLLNHYLGQFPILEYNLTQLGDASIALSFLFLLLIKTPKMWENLLSSLLLCAVFSKVLKLVFHMPRPAQILPIKSFIIVGKTISGYNSLPSGHSITIFAILTIVLFAFMPKSISHQIIWSIGITCFGLLVAFSRVGVGAHFPLDVVFGSIIGYITAILGILFCQKFTLLQWVENKKYYPIFILAGIICSITIISKLFNDNLIVYYFALICLFVSLYNLIYVYFKKENPTTSFRTDTKRT